MLDTRAQVAEEKETNLTVIDYFKQLFIDNIYYDCNIYIRMHCRQMRLEIEI